MRLDIAAGTAVRFEPGQTREVQLVALAGKRVVYGFRGEAQGQRRSAFLPSPAAHTAVILRCALLRASKMGNSARPRIHPRSADGSPKGLALQDDVSQSGAIQQCPSR